MMDTYVFVYENGCPVMSRKRFKYALALSVSLFCTPVQYLTAYSSFVHSKPYFSSISVNVTADRYLLKKYNFFSSIHSTNLSD